MVRISNFQLFSLIVLFEIGSTTLFALGIDAEQNAWIAILIAMFIGFFLIWVYTEIQKNYPDKNLADILLSELGIWLGGPLVILYALEFFWIGTLNFREFGELVSIILLPRTHIIIILGIFILIAVYILLSGYEVLARLGEVMLPFVLFFLLSIFILVIFSGNADFTRLQPILGDGIVSVLDAAFQVVNFPFGEAVVFLMYWQYVNKKQYIRRTSLLAISLSGILLTCSLMMIVSVLGVQYAKNSEVPLFEVVELINIADIITNLDAITAIIMFIGGFFKMILHFYAGVLALKSLFKTKKEYGLLLLSAICFTWFSLAYYENLIFHRWVGLKLSITYWYSFFTYFEITCPILLLMIIWLKNKRIELEKM